MRKEKAVMGTNFFRALAVLVTVAALVAVTIKAKPVQATTPGPNGPIAYTSQWDDKANFDDLDYGLYWFKCGDCRSDGQQDGVKADTPNLGTEYYDPSKPTMIYVHGIQDTGRYERESLLMPVPDHETDQKPRDTVKPWKDKGWNVGVFYWNQIADDFLVGDSGSPIPPLKVEAKIWDSAWMRWRDKTGGFHGNDARLTDKTAADLFKEEYEKVLASNTSGDIRIASHSIGNQVAIRGTELLQKDIDKGKASASLLPKRIALLDPYYYSLYQDYYDNNYYLGYKTIDRASEFVRELMDKGTLFEYYQTTQLPGTYKHAALADQMAYTRLYPDYVGTDVTDVNNQVQAHREARYWYLSSAAYDPPPAEDPDTHLPTEDYAPSASTTDETLKTIDSCTSGCYSWEQIDPKNTFDVKDDRFNRLPVALTDTYLYAVGYPTTVSLGTTSNLYGLLYTTSFPYVVANKRVIVERSTDDGTTWTKDGTATYDSLPYFYTATTAPLTQNTSFRMRFDGDRSHKGSTSSKVDVQVR